jgi:folate-binding protein YgfZ
MHPTPLHASFDAADAHWERYGPLTPGGPVIAIAGAFDIIDLEYAAIRRTCALIDLPTRGTVEVTGADAIAFLHRMVTQELKNWPAMTARQAFWLSRKGRIDADLRLLNLTDQSGPRVLIDADALVAPAAAQSLGSYVIADDVTITDVTQSWHRLGLHGPGAGALLARAGEPVAGLPAPAELAPGQVTRVRIAGAEVIADRCDTAGEIGLELWIKAHDLSAVFEKLLQFAHADHPALQPGPAPHPRAALRPIGWHAFNVARIEAGTPLFNVDFGTTSLPAESGLLTQRVSFTKGCYLGQEIVARMNALGKPKQVVVALRIGQRPLSSEQATTDATSQPGPAASVFLPGTQDPIGAITSATTSPMLGGVVVAFASVKTAHSDTATSLEVELEPGGPRASAIIQPRLAFWSRQVS